MMFFVFIVALLGFAKAENLNDDFDSSLMQDPDLFEGDILSIESDDDRAAIPYPEYRWTNEVVPYTLDPSLAEYSDSLQKAINDFYEKTCIRFKPRTNEENYVKIFPGKGCFSNVGMVGGDQLLSLPKRCWRIGVVIHEMGHTVGLYHEQNRPDRDKYLIIYWENIKEGMESEFRLMQRDEILMLDDFDFDSIMLYGSYAFAKDNKSPTMMGKSGKKLKNPWEKDGLSPSDVYRINTIYDCLDSSEIEE